MKVRVTRTSLDKFAQLSVGGHEGERMALGRGVSANHVGFVEDEARAGNGGTSIRKGLLLKHGDNRAEMELIPSLNQINGKIRRDKQMDDEGKRLPSMECILDVLRWCERRECHTAEQLGAVTSEREVVILEVRSILA